MFGLTTIEARFASYALILVGIAGYTLYERHQGEKSIERSDKTAELRQAQHDLEFSNSTVADLRKHLAAIPSDVPDAVPLRVCYTSYRLSENSSARSTQPDTLPHSGTDTGVQTGIESGTDIGAIVQDITLSGVLAATDAHELWELASKESKQ